MKSEEQILQGRAARRQLIFVWNYLNWGGAQIYLLAIMKEAKADWDIVVLLPIGSSPDILKFLDDIGVRYEQIDATLDFGPAPTIRRKLARHLSRFRAEIATLRHLLRYDLRNSILHIDAAPWQSWQLFTALALRGANVFVTLHNALPKTSPRWRLIIWKLRMHFVARLPGFHIFTSNEDTKENFRDFLPDEFWRSIKVTYTCVNPPEIREAAGTEFDRYTMLERFAIQQDKFVILCVGQFIDRKGRWVFLDAAREVIGRTADTVFVWLAPEMPGREDLDRVAAYDLDDRFRLLLSSEVGTSRMQILTFFRIADVFALPSYLEGLPIALLEAMVLQIPSISTRVNAIPEAVTDGETGILIDAGDSMALAEAILLIKRDSFLSNKIAATGSAFVLEKFDERVASRIAIDAYTEALRNARRV